MSSYYTDYLSPSGSLLVGAGTVFNLAGDSFLVDMSRTPVEADLRAIRRDWEMVGQDIGDVLYSGDLEKLLSDVSEK